MRTLSWNIKKYPRIHFEKADLGKKAFVIHGKHDVLSIYYAKFPNEYLNAIAKYGHKYKDVYTSSIIITLHRTQKFRMRRTDDRVKFFRFLARVLFYLVSGKARVGYLFDYEENPIHALVFVHYIFPSNKCR